MTPDPFEMTRIDVSDEVSVWVPNEAASGTAVPDSPSRPQWRVRPLGLGLGGVLALAALLRIGFTPTGLLAAGVLGVLAVLAAIDLEARLLPNRIVFPTFAAVLAWQLVFLPDRLAEAGLAALGAGAFMLVPCLFRRGAIGMGDVKVAAILGAALGGEVVDALAIGLVAAWPVALVLVIRRTAVRGATIPLGPFLGAGAAVVLLG